jgi:hypothetical protein
MSPPAAGSASSQSVWVPGFAPEPTQSAPYTGDRVSEDSAPRLCSTCSEPLSVAERMFYFLEGTDAVPRCRSCLGRQELRREITGAPPAPGATAAPLTPRERASAAGPGGRAGLNEMVRTYIREELDRIDTTLRQVPENDAEVPVVRSLQEEALRELSDDRLPEAILWLGEIRRKLSDLDRDDERPEEPPRADWDESVDEMYGRVSARAKALRQRRTAPAATAPPETAPQAPTPSP